VENENKVQRDANGEIIIDDALRAASRKKLLWIFALFFVPLLLATIWLQMVKASGGAWGSTSRGELIAPAVPLTEFALTEVSLAEEGSDTPFQLDDLRGKWSIVYAPGATCDAACESTLYDIRQARLALNHRMERVQRVLLVEQVPQFDTTKLEEQTGLRIVSGNSDMLATLESQITSAQQKLEAKQNLIYLVDPLGNLMMRYTSDQLPRPLFKDLKHLLKTSRVG